MEVFLSKCFSSQAVPFSAVGKGAQQGLFGPRPGRNPAAGPFLGSHVFPIKPQELDVCCREPLTFPVTPTQLGCLPRDAPCFYLQSPAAEHRVPGISTACSTVLTSLWVCWVFVGDIFERVRPPTEGSPPTATLELERKMWVATPSLITSVL